MAPIAVWNQSNPQENAIVRSIAALPFLTLLVWSFISLHGFGINTITGPHLNEVVLAGRASSVPTRRHFLDLRAVDQFWRPRPIVFVPSTMEVDPVSWFQNFSFLVDYSMLYSIWLFESARRLNEYTPARFPVLFGLAAQFFGPGVVAPLYFFLHYANTPLNRMRSPRMRKINPQFARNFFLALALFSYLPVLLMFFGPSPPIRHLWAWVWQMFPLWVSVGQWIKTRMSVEEGTLDQDQVETSEHDSNIIRATILAFATVSAGVWIYMLLNSPYSLTTIFVPQNLSAPNSNFVSTMRRHFQISHLLALGSSLMWLVYLFADLKNADLVQQRWTFLLSTGALMTLCLGPGCALAAGWCWREEILRRESNKESQERVEKGNGKDSYKKLAQQSLDDICFGGVKANFKVL